MTPLAPTCPVDLRTASRGEGDDVRHDLVRRALSLTGHTFEAAGPDPKATEPFTPASSAARLHALVLGGHLAFQPIRAAFCTAEGRRIPSDRLRTVPLHLPDAWLAFRVRRPSTALASRVEGPIRVVLRSEAPWHFALGDDVALPPDTTFAAYRLRDEFREIVLVPHFQLNHFLAACAPDELALEASLPRLSTSAARLKDPSRIVTYVESSDLDGTTISDPADAERPERTLRISAEFARKLRQALRGRLDRHGRLRGGVGPFDGVTIDVADRLALERLAANGVLRSDPLATRRTSVPACPDCQAPAVWREARGWWFVPGAQDTADSEACAQPAWVAAARPSPLAFTVPGREGLPLATWRCRACDHEYLDESAQRRLADALDRGDSHGWFDARTAFEPPDHDCPDCSRRDWERTSERVADGWVQALELTRPARPGTTRVVTCEAGDPVRRWIELATTLDPATPPPRFVAFARLRTPSDSPPPRREAATALRLARLAPVRDRPLDPGPRALEAATLVHRLQLDVTRLAIDTHGSALPWIALDRWWRQELDALEVVVTEAVERLDLPLALRRLTTFHKRTVRRIARQSTPSMFAPGSLREGLDRLGRLWSPFLGRWPLDIPEIAPTATPGTERSIELSGHFDRLQRLRRQLRRPHARPDHVVPGALGLFLREAGPHAAPWLGVTSLTLEDGPDGPATRLHVEGSA